ncbi:PREDICTED: O-glucosyltransferase rumi homolog isoform X2 [Tarenaya hassleriana]|uniref:O-glucosyltransferase rumi homolog isoform X2 n=1 Tax=Tarenaya hassleriana TaxID=28532 RepID=UPI00053C4B7B|nr:PREDICTED: O-glucosyltransferase rumi homolog isoform X2 [Tarenaya hassleriana]
MNSIFSRSRALMRSRFSDIKIHRTVTGKCHVATYTLILFLFVTALAVSSSLWLNSNLSNRTMTIATETNRNPPQETETLINCTSFLHLNRTQTGGFCPKPARTGNSQTESHRTCPDYFKWIHEDLKPWRETGITRETVERAKTTAHFRLVIVNGRVFVEKYKKSIQTRDVFTIWGILQLLRKYPGKLPDMELMFDCDDRPVIRSDGYRGARTNRTVEDGPPALFRYCGDRWTVDIVFPDWSFWGWAEINIRPWEMVLREMEEGKKKKKWGEREPYAYWKGNPFVSSPTRQDLLTCNLTLLHDWNARLFIQDWILEGQRGFENSNVAKQCTYRYKIYVEGYAWSVSEKYILACDSVTLMVKPYFYDFFTRSLQPLQHYWPINDNHKCSSIKFAVDWLNNNSHKIQTTNPRKRSRNLLGRIHLRIGRRWIQEEKIHDGISYQWTPQLSSMLLANPF